MPMAPRRVDDYAARGRRCWPADTLRLAVALWASRCSRGGRRARISCTAWSRWTKQLAAIHARTRIARDMHDVLAHSLTTFSLQTQAVRQVVTRHPDQAARMLDEMAEVV